MHLHKYFAILLLIIFHSFSFQALANTNTQDSIQKFDKETFQASLKELAPKEFARLFTHLHDQDSIKAISCIEYARKNMVTSENLEVQFWGYYSLAKWENYKINFEASIVYVKKVIEVAMKINTSDFLLYAYILEGSCYYDYSKYKESMESYLKAIKLAKIVKGVGRQLAISLNISLLKIEVGDNKGAIDLLEGTLKIIEEEHTGKFKVLEISLYIALAKSYMLIGEYDKALYCGNRGIELSNLCGDEDAKAYLYNYLGETNIALGNYKKASRLLDKAWKKAHEIKSAQSQLPLINLNRAKIYYHNGNYKKAIAILEKVEIEQEQKNTSFFNLEDMYIYLGKSYKSIDVEKSLYYFEKANEVYIINDKRQNEVSTEIIKKYDLAELKEELDVAEEKSKNKSIWLSVSICSMLVLVMSFGIFHKKREKQNKKKFQELLSISTALKEDTKKEAAIKTGAESEKNDISETIAFEILKRLEKFENKELYLKKGVTLSGVASKVDTNPKYLSKTVNKYKGKSFSNYIKDLRMDYVIDRLKNDKKFRSYTIEAIAKEIGYNNSKTFSKSFKLKTGLYPSYFIKQLHQISN